MKLLDGIRATAGTLCLTFLALLAASGWALAAGYVPSESEAFASVLYWRQTGGLGAVLRGLHYHLSSGLVVAGFVYLLATFLANRHRDEMSPRREADETRSWGGASGAWWLALTIFLLGLGWCFTGYLLPMDQNAYWGTVVRLGIVETSPIVGPMVADALRGGSLLNAATLPRFYTLHVSILPLICALLLVWLLRHLTQLSAPSGDEPRAQRAEARPPTVPDSTTRLTPETSRPRQQDTPGIPKGRTFEANEHEARSRTSSAAERTRTSSAAVWLIFALIAMAASYAVALRYPAPLELPADPTDSEYIPRPEWYFLWLFQFGKYVESVPWVRSLLLPVTGLGLLYVLPLLRRQGARFRTTLAAGWCAAWIALTALATWEDRELPPKLMYEPAMQVQAAEHYQSHCYDCHDDDGRGLGPQTRAFDLEVSDLTLEQTWLESSRKEMYAAIRDGKGQDMPAFGRKLTAAQTDALIDYLETSFRPQEPEPSVRILGPTPPSQD